MYPIVPTKAYTHETPIMTTLITSGNCFGFLDLFSTDRILKQKGRYHLPVKDLHDLYWYEKVN